MGVRRVRQQPPVQPDRHRRQLRVVEHGLAEGAEQRRHRGHRGQAVPLHVRDQRPDPERPHPYVVQVAAHERAALRRPVEARAAHLAHPFRHRRQHRQLGRLRDRTHADQLFVPALADPGDDHAEQPDDGHRGQVRPPGLGDADVVHPQQQQDHGCEDRGSGRPVRERRHGGQARQEEAQLHVGRERLREDERHQGRRGRDPGPARRWLAAQPARLSASASHPSTLVRGPGPRTPDRPAGWLRPLRAATVGA